MREVELDVPLKEKWGEALVAVEPGESIHVFARLESVHEGILATAEVDAQYRGVCGRCLTDISAPVEVEFQELFAYPGQETSDLEVQDDHVDLETPVRDAIVLTLPFQPVCRPDCPGLDPATGEPMADGSGTEPRADLDPRWAALAEYTATDADGGRKP
ncbi:YceD family protein [Microbacterium limosum]|uniref:YceD family protein n=1 Tax=Microbacterium limosum TaxID=3079935 RepID=A0AAU0MJ71_9MICO|nr:YceD family protein [Microbacterium sp. Y20]WOQ70523.1 YceD family protein [Microbacterium sp. Y20]